MKKLRDLPKTLPETHELNADQLLAVRGGSGCSSGSSTATVSYRDNMCVPDSDSCNDATGIGGHAKE
jgi:hypothetical protein